MVKNPDRMVVSPGETINWTLRGFHNPTGEEVADFTIIDRPGLGLNFQSGSLPAFTNGAGITYEIRYTVAGSNQWRVHATGIDASQPFTFSLPQPGDLYYTNIGFFFGNVPADFALGNQIVLTFVVGDNAPNNTLINSFAVGFNSIEREGYSPYRPIVTPGDDTPQPTPTPGPQETPGPDVPPTPTPTPTPDPGQATPDPTSTPGQTTPTPTLTPTPGQATDTPPGRMPITGLDSNITKLLAGLALSALVSVAAIVIIRKHKKESST